MGILRKHSSIAVGTGALLELVGFPGGEPDSDGRWPDRRG